jgi:hypothetical protein
MQKSYKKALAVFVIAQFAETSNAAFSPSSSRVK